MNRSVVFAALCICVGAGESAAQTRSVRGRVMVLDGVSVQGLTLRIVGTGDAVVTRSGEFAFEVPADADEVTLESRDPERPIVYPPAGRTPVPAGDAMIVVVIGRPVEEEIRRALADRSLQLERVLREGGVQTGQRLDSLESGIRRVIEALSLREEDLRADIARGEERATRFGPIAEPTRAWLGRATDLVTGLRLMRPLLGEGRQQIMDGVRDVVAPYNDAWNAWFNGRDAAVADLRRYWPGEEADVGTRMFEEIERTHRARILPLNEALGSLQRALIERRSDREVDAALAVLDTRAADLAAEIEATGTLIERTLERLSPR